MQQTLIRGDRIEIRGFGTFHLNYRPPRTGRNPKTGDLVDVPGKHVPHFKAGKALREAIDPNLVETPGGYAGDEKKIKIVCSGCV